MHNFLLKVKSLYYLYTYIKGWSFVLKSWCNGPSKDFRKGEFWWKTYNEFYGFPFLLGKNTFTRKPFKIKTVNQKYVHILYFWPIQAHVLYGLFSKKSWCSLFIRLAWQFSPILYYFPLSAVYFSCYWFYEFDFKWTVLAEKKANLFINSN